MAVVLVSPSALRDLDIRVRTHSLPATTFERVRVSLESLRRFPLLGAPLYGRWANYRFILGPWRWMIIVYEYNENLDRAVVVTIQDGRSSHAATSAR